MGFLKMTLFPNKVSLCPKQSLKWLFFYKPHIYLPSLQMTNTDPEFTFPAPLKRARALKHYGTD